MKNLVFVTFLFSLWSFSAIPQSGRDSSTSTSEGEKTKLLRRNDPKRNKINEIVESKEILNQKVCSKFEGQPIERSLFEKTAIAICKQHESSNEFLNKNWSKLNSDETELYCSCTEFVEKKQISMDQLFIDIDLLMTVKIKLNDKTGNLKKLFEKYLWANNSKPLGSNFSKCERKGSFTKFLDEMTDFGGDSCSFTDKTFIKSYFFSLRELNKRSSKKFKTHSKKLEEIINKIVNQVPDNPSILLNNYINFDLISEDKKRLKKMEGNSVLINELKYLLKNDVLLRDRYPLDIYDGGVNLFLKEVKDIISNGLVKESVKNALMTIKMDEAKNFAKLNCNKDLFETVCMDLSEIPETGKLEKDVKKDLQKISMAGLKKDLSNRNMICHNERLNSTYSRCQKKFLDIIYERGINTDYTFCSEDVECREEFSDFCYDLKVDHGEIYGPFLPNGSFNSGGDSIHPTTSTAEKIAGYNSNFNSNEERGQKQINISNQNSMYNLENKVKMIVDIEEDSEIQGPPEKPKEEGVKNIEPVQNVKSEESLNTGKTNKVSGMVSGEGEGNIFRKDGINSTRENRINDPSDSSYRSSDFKSTDNYLNQPSFGSNYKQPEFQDLATNIESEIEIPENQKDDPQLAEIKKLQEKLEKLEKKNELFNDSKIGKDNNKEIEKLKKRIEKFEKEAQIREKKAQISSIPSKAIQRNTEDSFDDRNYEQPIRSKFQSSLQASIPTRATSAIQQPPKREKIKTQEEGVKSSGQVEVAPRGNLELNLGNNTYNYTPDSISTNRDKSVNINNVISLLVTKYKGVDIDKLKTEEVKVRLDDGTVLIFTPKIGKDNKLETFALKKNGEESIKNQPEKVIKTKEGKKEKEKEKEQGHFYDNLRDLFSL